MDNKEKKTSKKTHSEDKKERLKNFYGEMPKMNTGVNSNKSSKWQPNDDLLQGNFEGSEIKKNKKFDKENNDLSFKYKDKKNYATFNKNEDNKKDKKWGANDMTFKQNDSKLKNKNSNKESDTKLPFKSFKKNKSGDHFKEESSFKKGNYETFKRLSGNRSGDVNDPIGKKSKDYRQGKSEVLPDYSETKQYYKKNNSETKTASPKYVKFKSKAISDEKLHQSADFEATIRLNKYIANAGICSRREADELIKAGAVSVNGKMITEMGFKVKRSDIVNYGGESLKSEKLVYIILNKPKDYITTLDDPQERKTVLSLIKGACKERVYPVGRLDRNTTGLLLLTNDGELTEKITHPSYGQKKIYHVELDKPVKPEHLRALAQGIELDDGHVKVDEIAYVSGANSKKEVGVTLHSGRNRIVRRMFEHFEYKVKKLDRVYFAGLTKKDLARGRWRFLTPMEINMLKMGH